MYSLLQPWDIDENDKEYGFMANEDCEQTIEGEKFTKLLDVMFEVSSYFSLNVAPWAACVDKSLEEELKNYMIKKGKVKNWFGYCFTGTKYFTEVYVYEAVAEAKDVLLKYYTDLWLQEFRNEKKVDSTQTLEDLCFFCDNKLLLGTVTHEAICDFYPNDKVDKEAILSLGIWRACDDDPQIIDIEELI